MNPSPHPVPLVEVRRGGRLECLHMGSVAVCDAAGRLVHSRGSPQQPIYLRSSAKFFQTLTVLRLGAADRWGFDAEEIALMCASHGAQPLFVCGSCGTGMRGNRMRRSFATLPALAALVLLAGCGGGDNEADVVGVNSEEAAQVNNAAEMLDASPDSLAAPENMPLETESNGTDNGV